jgi:hypothetical protein
MGVGQNRATGLDFFAESLPQMQVQFNRLFGRNEGLLKEPLMHGCGGPFHIFPAAQNGFHFSFSGIKK